MKLLFCGNKKTYLSYIEVIDNFHQSYPDIAMNSIRPFQTNYKKKQIKEQVLANRARKKEEKMRQKQNTEKVIEASVKTIIYLGFSFLAIMSIKSLYPYHIAQQQKLAEIDQEISKIKPRVDILEENFTKTFAPQEGLKVMQKNSYKIDPNLTRIFFTSSQ